MKRIYEKLIFGGRMLLLPMYLGLSLALAVYALRFTVQTGYLLWNSLTFSDTQVLVAVLHLLDIIMVSHLIVMIMIGGYVLFIASAEAEGLEATEKSDPKTKAPKLKWLGHLDPGALKVKMSMSMLGVSSIHLLEAFINAEGASVDHLTKLIAIHLVFVVSTMAVAWVNRYAFQQDR